MAERCDVAAGLDCGCGPREPFDWGSWWRIAAGILIAGNSMTVSLAINVSESTPGERAAVHGVLFGLAVVSLVLLGWPLARNAVRALRRRRITIEAMFLAGILGAMTASVVAALTGTGEVYFEIVVILLVVYSLGQQLTARAQERALRATARWAPGATRCTVLREDGGSEQIPVERLVAGQRVLVPPGSMIAADGVVEDGVAFVREAEMTGELFAVVRRPGDRVWAGTVCVDSSLTVLATADGRHRRIDGILEAVERARAVPSTLQSQADRLVGRFLPVVVLLALATWVGWTLAAGWERGLFNAMAVLLVACPCALGLATPLAVWAALARLASRGLVVRGGDAVEALAAVDAAVFDKTGTLTEPEATLVDLVAAEKKMSRADLLRLLAGLEAESRHPVASAFVGAVEDPAGGASVSRVRLLPGTGIVGRVTDPASGRSFEVTIGAASRLVQGGDQGWETLADGLRAPPAAHRLAVLVDDELEAAAAVDERMRASWPRTLERLRARRVETLVMTGDIEERARLAEADRVAARVSPEGKLAAVQEMQRAGRRVLFVGDGVNDAAAMAASDVSVAVAGGADLAAEVADVAWHGEDLEVVPWAIEVAGETVRVIRSNLLLAVSYNVAGIGLAMGGVLHPVAAALLMTCSSLVVTWRAAGVLHQEEGAAAGMAPEGSWAPASTAGEAA